MIVPVIDWGNIVFPVLSPQLTVTDHGPGPESVKLPSENVLELPSVVV